MSRFLYPDNKFIFFLHVFAIALAISCNNADIKNKHPQAKLGADAELIDEASINGYADSINMNLSDYETRESLVYNKETYSFYVTRYSSNGEPVLFVERGNGETGSIEKHYYVRDGLLILYKEDVFNSYQSPRYKSHREYYRNNVLFYADGKHAEDATEFKTAKYAKVEKSKRDTKEVLENLQKAIDNKGEFELSFEGITEYPKARYIVLSGKELNSYRAVIRVEDDDDFIRDLVSNTEKYKGTPLNIRWKIKDGEAFYQGQRN